MKTNLKLLQTRIVCAVALGIGSFFGLAAATEDSADTAPATTAIPWSQLGAKAAAGYQDDALAVIPTAEGARLRCRFQRLEGEATYEGLWLTSTVIPPGGTANDRFRLLAVEVGRGTPCSPSAAGGGTNRSANIQPSTSGNQLSATGKVSIDGPSVRFTRPGLVEEYTASMDGVRQDFVVLVKNLSLCLPTTSMDPTPFTFLIVDPAPPPRTRRHRGRWTSCREKAQVPTTHSLGLRSRH